MRRALQYGAITGRKLALHCEEPTLSRDGQVHEGAVSRRARLRRLPLCGGERDGRARPLARRVRGAAAPPDAPLGAGVGRRAARPRRRAGVAATAEVTPHHLVLTDEAVRGLDPNVKMNPPLRSEDDRQALIAGLRERRDRRRRNRPRAALARGEGGAVRGGAVRRHRSRDGLCGALHPSRRAGPPAARDAARADVRRPGARARAARAAARGRRPRRTSSCSTSRPSGRSRRRGFRSRSANSWLLGERLRGAVAEDRRRRPAGARMTAFLALEDGTVFRGESVGADGARLRRGGLHDRDDRLPGDGHRPELRRAARLLHGADGRQLRRRRRPRRVAGRAREGGADARGARPRVDGLARRARDRRR